LHDDQSRLQLDQISSFFFQLTCFTKCFGKFFHEINASSFRRHLLISSQASLFATMSLFPDGKIEGCEEIIGHKFWEKSLLAQALNGTGATHFLHGVRIESNRSLAMYGDIIVTNIFGKRWFDQGLSPGRSPYLFFRAQDRSLNIVCSRLPRNQKSHTGKQELRRGRSRCWPGRLRCPSGSHG
jgi:hypothetical protein